MKSSSITPVRQPSFFGVLLRACHHRQLTGALVWAGLGSSIFLGGCHFAQHGTTKAGTTTTNNKLTASTPAIRQTAKVSVGPGGPRTASPMTEATPAPLTPKATKEIRVGEVRVIGSGRRFVLIEVLPQPDLPVLSPGLELRTRAPVSATAGGEQTGTLRVSPERRQPFIVADVVDGQPLVDDPVYYSAENQLHLVPSILTTPIYAPTPAFDTAPPVSGSNPAEPPHP